MPPIELTELLQLPAGERAELAMTLWDSLSEGERNAQFVLSPEEAAELDRRWSEHLAEPSAGIPWQELRQKLRDGE